MFFLLALFLFGSYVYSNYLFSSHSSSMFQIQNIRLNGEEDDLSYRRIMTDQAREYRFSAEFSLEELHEHLPQDSSYKLMLYRIAGNWIIVRLNGIQIGSVGNLENNRSNIWNSLNYVDIPHRLIEQENTIEIIVNATHQVGGMPDPVFIMDSYTAAEFRGWFDFILIYITLIAQGILLFSFVLFLFISFFTGLSNKYEYLFFAIAAILMTINLLDYLPYYHFPLPYLLTKNITLGALYLCFAAINFGLYRLLKSKATYFIAWSLIIAYFFILLFFNSNAAVFKESYSYTNILILISNITWIVVTARNWNKNSQARIMLAVSVVLLFAVSVDIILGILQIVLLYTFAVFGTIVFCIGLAFLVVIDYLQTSIRLESESKKAETHYQKSIRDGLTGVYNKRYIMSLLDTMPHPYAVLMIDIDHFKQVNDTYGHGAGDEVIRFFAVKAVEAVRRHDIVGRFGGDEFIIILPECQEGAAENIAQRLQNNITSFYSESFPEDFVFTLSIGIYYANSLEDCKAEALERADKALYQSKENGRNQYSTFKKD